MHGCWGERFHLPLTYGRVRVERSERILPLAELLKLDGFNVTAPFKTTILPQLSSLDERAEKLGAVNTVLRTKSGWRGLNTDVDGVADALLRRGFVPQGQRTLVVGAGGASSAAVQACQHLGLRVTLVNRTLERARTLAEGLGVEVGLWSDRLSLCARTDLLVLAAAVDEADSWIHALPSGAWVLQADYRHGLSTCSDSMKGRFTLVDGLDWLIGQGAAAFHHFTGQGVDEDGLTEANRRLRTERGALGDGHLCLTGLPGSGKTSLAEAFSRKSRLNVVDLDEEISRSQRLSVADLFTRFGEGYFRSLESTALEAVLKGPSAVVSLGGGIVEKSGNRALLAREKRVVWLALGSETAAARIRGQKGRPLLDQGDGYEIMADLFRRREAHYFSLADLILDGEASLEELVEGLHEEVG